MGKREDIHTVRDLRGFLEGLPDKTPVQVGRMSQEGMLYFCKARATVAGNADLLVIDTPPKEMSASLRRWSPKSGQDWKYCPLCGSEIGPGGGCDWCARSHPPEFTTNVDHTALNDPPDLTTQEFCEES